MSHSLVISDLHLCDSRPHIQQLFLDFLQRQAKFAEALYILGDFFEYWAGDDDLETSEHQPILQGLHQLSSQGTRIFFMHGNRDFLIGDRFADMIGATLLADPALVEMYGKRVLLSHGDTLCTDDVEYQKFRQQVRSPVWQQAFLAQPLATRKAQIEELRRRSEQEKSGKDYAIMDVNADAVTDLLREYDYPPLLIHGHTHRQGSHSIDIDGHACQRWVLGDWFEQGNSLRCDASGCRWQNV